MMLLKQKLFCLWMTTPTCDMMKSCLVLGWLFNNYIFLNLSLLYKYRVAETYIVLTLLVAHLGRGKALLLSNSYYP